MSLMRMFTTEDDDVPINMPPEPGREHTDTYAEKRTAALAVLGDKWCLAKTREAQLDEAKRSALDLV